jgi:hypothetical protein
LRSNAGLVEFFLQSSRGNTPVVEAHVAMDLPHLEAFVGIRQKIVERLEHVIAEEKITGKIMNHIEPLNYITQQVRKQRYLKEL